MRGPSIITRTLSATAIADKYGNTWQYHSRSDHHSKIACWAIAFDLLETSTTLRRHVTDGRVTFGINRRLNDYETGKKKDLDLVVARAPHSDPKGPATSDAKLAGRAFDLAELAQRFGVDLTDDDRSALDDLALPPAPNGSPGATVLVALEAKACMTAHIAALPRLHDELTSSHAIVHGDTHSALSVGFVMVNTATEFASPGKNTRPLTPDAPAEKTPHVQPHATERTVDMLQEVRRRSGPQSNQAGFDALGIMLVDMINDGSAVTLSTAPPAPEPGSAFHYDNMIGRIAQLYENTYGNLS